MTVNVAGGVAAGGVVAVYRISGLVRRKYSCVTALRIVDVQVEPNVILSIVKYILSLKHINLHPISVIKIRRLILYLLHLNILE